LKVHYFNQLTLRYILKKIKKDILLYWIKKWTSPKQDPVKFPLEYYTQGVVVDLFLIH